MKLTKPAPRTEQDTLQCRIDAETARRFATECKRIGISVSEGMRQLIDQFLKRGK